MADINDHQTGDYGLLIYAKHVDGPEFGEQTALIRSSGASFDADSKEWWLWLDQALTGDMAGLNTLFKAAAEHGTYIAAQKRERLAG